MSVIALEPIEKARLLACQKWPYAASAILALVKVSSPHVPHIAADRHWRLYYNPAVLSGMPIEEAAGQILREVSRLILRHAERAELLIGEKPSKGHWKLWNLASDYAVNDALRCQGVSLPADAVYPESAGLERYLTAEEYYLSLREQYGDQGDDDGEGEGDADGEGQDGEGQEGQGKPGEGQGRGQGKGQGQPGKGRRQPPQDVTSGSSADGIYRPWEKGAPGEEGEPGLEDHEANAQIRVVAEKIDTIGHGDERGGFRTAAVNLLRPKTDPKSIFRRHIRKACQDFIKGIGEFSYRRTSRRSQPDMPLPGGVEAVPRILIIVDTSGSMDQQDIGKALGFINDVLSAYRLRDGVKVACADTQVHSVTKVFDAKKLNIRGGGGTDMSHALKQIVDLPKRERPELVVVATDGYTGWPSQPLDVPAVAVLTRPIDSSYPLPKWLPGVVIKD